PVCPASCRAFFLSSRNKNQTTRECRLLLAADHHRAVFHVGAEHAAKRAACRAARVDIFRNYVVAIGATCLARALVAFAPVLARIAAAAVDREARFAV